MNHITCILIFVSCWYYFLDMLLLIEAEISWGRQFAQTSWATTLNLYSTNFCGCCVITPLVVGLWLPSFYFNILFSLWSIDNILLCAASLQFVSFPSFLETVIDTKREIVGKVSLSSPSLGCSVIAYPSFGWGTSSPNNLIVFLPKSANKIIIFWYKQLWILFRIVKYSWYLIE